MGEWKSPEVVASEASVGDLIEFDSGQHQHWAIFAGRKDNISFLIHLWQESDAQEHKVRYDDFPRVAAGRRCRVNNKYDHNGRFPAEEVIRRAHSQLNNCGLHNKPFEMFRNNCEHFASWCRNGQPFSEQSTSKDLVFKFMARAWHEISNGQNPSSGFSS